MQPPLEADKGVIHYAFCIRPHSYGHRCLSNLQGLDWEEGPFRGFAAVDFVVMRQHCMIKELLLPTQQRGHPVYTGRSVRTVQAF